MAMVMAGMLLFVEAIIMAVAVFGNLHQQLGVAVQLGFGKLVRQMRQCRVQVGAQHGRREDHGEQGATGQT